MGFSYDMDAVLDNGMDRIRFELGDIDSTDVLLQDEEIELILEDTPNWQTALAKSARIIESRFRRLLEQSIGDIRVEYTKRAETWSKMRQRFEQLAPEISAVTTAGMGLSAGGISGESAQKTYYGIHMHEAPGTAPDKNWSDPWTNPVEE